MQWLRVEYAYLVYKYAGGSLADAHANPRDTLPHEERSVKEICRTIREKVRVMVEEVRGWVCFSYRVTLRVAELKFQPWLPGGRLIPNLLPTFTKIKEKGYFSQSCVMRSAVIV